jgi:hypothetical protein
MSINLVQSFNVEVDSIDLLKEYLKLSLTTILNSTDMIAVKNIEHDISKAFYYSLYNNDEILPVILIEGWYKSDNNHKHSYFDGFKPWTEFNSKNNVNQVIVYVIGTLEYNYKELKNRFINECGTGNKNFDGSIDIGYKLMSNNTFPHSLSISLTHIYYHK